MTTAAASAGDATARGRLFISFASEDIDVATRIRNGVEQAGMPCWMAPRDIEPGTSFPAAITAAISSASALVLLLTEASNASPHVLSEVELAFNARKPIVAILVAGVKPSANLQYFISTTHWFDAEKTFDDDDLARLKVDLEKLLAGERLRLDEERARVRRRTGVVIAAVAVAAIVVVALAVYGLRGRSNPSTQGQGAGPIEPARETGQQTVPPPANPAPPLVTNPETPLITPPDQAAGQTPGQAPSQSASSSIKTRTNPADNQVYIWIPPGRYTMGCSPGDPDCQPDELPAHGVRVAGFWLAKTEVTVAQYLKRATLEPSESTRLPKGAVSEVTWAEAKAYCAAIGGRLPTEAEWEYAARGGVTERYYEVPRAAAWYRDNSDDHVHEVGGKAANAYGLYDMLGNVYEWVLDRYYNKYDDTDTAIEEPLASNASATARGGAWTSGANDVRVSNRFDLPPDAAEPNVGFRCALRAKN